VAVVHCGAPIHQVAKEQRAMLLSSLARPMPMATDIACGSLSLVRAVPANVLEQIVACIPAGRVGKPEEIARAVPFLLADEAGFITGSTLTINGGQYMD
jgi:NAD(P)-dependent dehydrogenase (short-subunit alcohol dehydrogenase family)